jgi:hypothetical protein
MARNEQTRPPLLPNRPNIWGSATSVHQTPKTTSDGSRQQEYASSLIRRPWPIWTDEFYVHALFRGMGVMRGIASAVIAAIIIGALYFGREVFVPIALAILLSFVLAPLVRLLQRWRVPRALSVIGVALVAFAWPADRKDQGRRHRGRRGSGGSRRWQARARNDSRGRTGA